jgi:hypothetical protein
MLNQRTMLGCRCKNRPSGIERINPVMAGIEESRPTWKLLAFKWVKKTGKKGDAAFAKPTPIASICTFE